MATYFPTSNNQRDAAMMLYSRDPLPSSYPETTVIPGNSMMYMNFSSSSGSGSFSDALSQNPQRLCIDIQPTGTSDSSSSQQEVMLNFGASRAVEHSVWKDSRNEMLMMQSIDGASGVFQSVPNLHGQGLSLSLGTHIPSGMQISPIQYQSTNSNFSSLLGPNTSFSSEERGSNSDAMKTDISPYGMPNMVRAVPSSKYLRAAQQLLDEIVNVKKAIKEQKFNKDLMKDSKEIDRELGDGASDPSAASASSVPPESSSNSTNELSAAEKQDLQNKMTKLLSMLDEVDRRYKQYYHQMQIVVSSFDVIAGPGAAQPYTTLALQTISRHFRCLRDAINGQIQVARKNLGEPEDSSNGKGIGISRLRYVDKQLRQQRALHQLGMMPQHAWRPQRGLPETSVSVLRAWLFEHFLHPYPKDSDKIMLARQTGLTRSQVSNWFINARVRLWKPMVEEMYKEEAGDTEMDSNSSSETIPRTAKTSQDKGEDLHHSATSTGQLLDSNSDHMHDIEMVGSDIYPTFRDVTCTEPQNNFSMRKTREDINDGALFQDSIVQSNCGNDRFIAAATAAYHISEIERFGSGNGVSLTLGLQQCEGSNIAISDHNHNAFVTTRGSDVYNTSDLAMVTETTEFDCMDSDNRQHQFVSSRLLHDFVA